MAPGKLGDVPGRRMKEQSLEDGLPPLPVISCCACVASSYPAPRSLHIRLISRPSPSSLHSADAHPNRASCAEMASSLSVCGVMDRRDCRFDFFVAREGRLTESSPNAVSSLLGCHAVSEQFSETLSHSPPFTRRHNNRPKSAHPGFISPGVAVQLQLYGLTHDLNEQPALRSPLFDLPFPCER